MPTVAFVTTSNQLYAAEDLDRPLHDAALAERSIELHHVPWDDPSAEWEAFDLVVIRSPWDYPDRFDEFSPWLDSVASLPNLHNPAGLIRWNLDKRYLADLAAGGVAVVPTDYAQTVDEVDGALAALVGAGADEVVIKPSVSAGSRLTGRFPVGSAAARTLAAEIIDAGKTVMVSPCVPSVAEVGERALVAFDGSPSHALVKGPILAAGGGLIGGEYREDIRLTTASDDELAIAAHALDAIGERAAERGWLPAGEPPRYARLDLVAMPDGTSALLEAELFEPTFFLPYAPGAVDRFADALVRRLEAR